MSQGFLEKHGGEASLRRLEEALGPAAGERAGDLAVAGAAAVAGGLASLRHYGNVELAVERKEGGSPVTEADHASNRAILSLLAEHRSDDAILSEESGAGADPSPSEESVAVGESRPATEPGQQTGAATGRPSRLWLVDPLDGTKEFMARNGEFSVMVGLADRGAAALGAVYQPEPGFLYLGAVDGGAWLVADRQQVGTLRPLHAKPWGKGPIRFIRSRSHGDTRLSRLREALGEVEVVLSGSVGIKCALIAAGRGDLYVHPVPYLKEWDTCAPEAILRGAGGWVTDCAGRPLRYGKPDPHQPAGIFAAGPGLWERVAPLIREAWPDLEQAET